MALHFSTGRRIVTGVALNVISINSARGWQRSLLDDNSGVNGQILCGA